jgi:hypothetical protein
MAEPDERRSSPGWLLSILILLGVVVGTGKDSGPSGGSGGEGRKASSGAGAGADEEGGAGGWEKGSEGDAGFLEPYLEFRDYHGASDAPGPHQDRDLGRLLALDLARVAPEFLIVTVPEPIDSRFGYRFDAILDAVQLAIESQGWNLDRFWLPWLPSGRQIKDRNDLKGVPDPHGREMLYERRPGVLLFRHPGGTEGHDPRQRVLVVLLVGETPTSGVAKGALAECLSIIKAYHRAVREGLDRLSQVPPPPWPNSLPGLGAALLHAGVRRLAADLSEDLGRVDVRVVGPMFSGSEQSLALTIARWMEENRGDPSWSWHVFVRSGDSDRIVKEEFERDAGGHGRFPNVEVRFDSTLVHIDAVVRALFDFLKQLNGGTPLGKVALLTESDTAFGQRFEKVQEWAGPGTNVTRMTFPFHVSQVAVAYKQGDSKDDRSTPTLVRPSSRLAIPFDEIGRPRDVVPALSPAMTTATNSFVLSKILETISMEDFRYIGIVATDTRDTIFLAGLIRQFCPDVQLFTPQGDLMLGHPRYADELRGMIVATPYPLFSMAQRWDPPYEGDHRRHLFSHQGDQGTFNAALSLLYQAGRPGAGPGVPFFESMYDYGLPFDELADLSAFWEAAPGAPTSWRDREPRLDGTDRGWRMALRRPSMRPPIWFSVIGQRGLWPVKYEDIGRRPVNRDYTFNLPYTKTVDAAQFAGQFPALVPQFTWQWGTVFLGLSAFAWLLFVVHARFALDPRAEFVPVLSWSEMLRPVGGADGWPGGRHWGFRDRLQRETYVLVGLLGFLGVYAYCALVPCWIAFLDSPWPLFLDRGPWDVASWSDHWNIRFAWLAFYSGNVTALALVWTIARRVGSWAGTDRALARWGLAAWFALVVLVLWVLSARSPLPPGRILEEYRSLARDAPALLLVPLWEGVRSLVGGAPPRPVGDPSPRLSLAAAWAWWLAVVALLAVLWSWRRRLASDERRRLAFAARCLAVSCLADMALMAAIGLPPALLVRRLFEGQWEYLPERFAPLLYFERAVNFGSGVSPVMPVVMLMLVAGLWIWSQMRRLDLAGRLWGPPRPRHSAYRPSRPHRGKAAGLRRGAGALARLGLGLILMVYGRLLRDTGRLLGGAARALRGRLARPPGGAGAGRDRIDPVLAWAEGFRGRAASFGERSRLRGLRFLVEEEGFVASPWRPPATPGPAPSPTTDNPAAADRPAPAATDLYAPEHGPARDRIQRVIDLRAAAAEVVEGWVPSRVLLRPAVLAGVGLVAIAMIRLCQRSLPGVDFPGWWTTLIMAVISFLALSIVITLGRFVCLWEAIGEFLREPVHWPMAPAYDRIPAPYAASLGRYLDRVRPSLASLNVLVKQWEVVANDFYEVADQVEARQAHTPGAPASDPGQFLRIKRAITTGRLDGLDPPSDGMQAARAIAARYHEELRGRGGTSRDEIARSRTWLGLRNAARACIAALEPFWVPRTAADGFGKAAEDETKAPKGTGDPHDEALRRWVREAEDLIALEVIMLVGQCSAHLKNLAYYLAVAPILLLMASSCYPFQPQRFLQVCLWTILLAVAACVVVVYVRMERDELLSRISGTSPNKVEFDRTFLTNILAFIIPLVGVALAKFPYVSDTLNQWLEPMSGVLK